MIDNIQRECGLVFIVDDDPVAQTASAGILERAGHEVRRFNSAEDFLLDFQLALCVDTAPSVKGSRDRGRLPRTFPIAGCLLLDIHMPGLDGIKLHQLLIKSDFLVPVIFLTGGGDVPRAVEAMLHGAIDFIEKGDSPDRLIRAVRRALKLDEALRDYLAEATPVQERLARLTDREREVLRELVRNATIQQIARKLGNRENTVRRQRAVVLEKMRATTVVEFTRMTNLVENPPAEVTKMIMDWKT